MFAASTHESDPPTSLRWHSLPAMLNTDHEFLALAEGVDTTFALTSRDGTGIVMRVAGGGVDAGDDPVFNVELDHADWLEAASQSPTPGTQHVLAHLAPRGTGTVLGDTTVFAQHVQLVRRAVEMLSNRAAATRERASGSLAAVTGRYVRIDVDPWGACDVFVETVGSGRPVLLLHTAGADGRQYHGLFTLAELFPGRQLIAFDLPWHGRSNPSYESDNLDYSLTSESYTACVAAVISALDLPEPPVIVGASMAGAAVIEMAARHPSSIAGVVSCQAGPRVANRHNAWQRSPLVNQTLFVPEWTCGLMSPHSPKIDRDRVWWGYSQGGFGVYERDIRYYTDCWDIDNVREMLENEAPPIVLMSGAYDYSVPSAATRELAAQIPSAIYRPMPELGHFPHAENPPVFAQHLAWALAAIDAAAVPGTED
ncbi:hypothetical protein ASC61_10700 [Aeromicrobium sp. Root344]|nr:hypothetical protein ASC61_10700 [Aeromicrobium sp. Root344]